MTSRIHLVFGILFPFAMGVGSETAAAPTDPEKDPRMFNLLQEAQTLVDGKKPAAAIEKCDQVINRFKTHYGSRKEKIYCARTPAESLLYLVKAGAAINQGNFPEGGAITLSARWADAYFIKAYALLDLQRVADAKKTIQQALALSPNSSHYLSELGAIYQLEKDWPKAKQTFEAAEDNAPVSPDDVKAEELARARRGIAYVLVELGQLDEAEKKYLQCLATDPDDKKAARELEYVREQKAKRKLL
jgi:tetratricopeptide (TPR) repeat protein